MDSDAVPGSELGFEEEYVAGEGTYTSDGKVYSTVLGRISSENRELHVLGPKTLTKPVVGDVVFGRVEMVVEPIALLVISMPSKDGKFYEQSSEYCVMHASSIGMGFVKNIHDFIKIGDLVKAKVIEIKPTEICLGLNGTELGIIKAFCTQDRRPMNLENGVLICPECGKKERRKVSPQYGSVMLK